MKFFTPIAIAFILMSCGSVSQKADYAWVLPAVDFDRQDYPFSMVLPLEIEPGKANPILVEVVNGQQLEVPCQISYGDEVEISWIVSGLSKAGQERKYELRFKKGIAETAEISVEKNDSTLLVHKGGNEILHYRHSTMPAPPGKSELFNRSGFIHPMFSPSGQVLTWAQPEDHIHHVGLWNPWTRVRWKGHHTDFWNLVAGLGTVRYKDVIATSSGPIFAEFHVLQDHIAFVPQKPPFPVEDGEESKEVIVIEEEWIVRVWNVDDGYLIDFTSLIRNVLDEDVSLDAYRYGGGIGYRATSKWNKDNSIVLTSEDKTRKDGDATRAKWCWISGDLEGIQTGLLFMSDPENYDFPQPMRIWPENSNAEGYQYFEFTPIREKAWVLEPGKTYSQKYRIWVQEGELIQEKAEQQWQQYAEALVQKNSYLTDESLNK